MLFDVVRCWPGVGFICCLGDVACVLLLFVVEFDVVVYCYGCSVLLLLVWLFVVVDAVCCRLLLIVVVVVGRSCYYCECYLVCFVLSLYVL